MFCILFSYKFELPPPGAASLIGNCGSAWQRPQPYRRRCLPAAAAALAAPQQLLGCCRRQQPLSGCCRRQQQRSCCLYFLINFSYVFTKSYIFASNKVSICFNEICMFLDGLCMFLYVFYKNVQYLMNFEYFYQILYVF